MSAYVFSAILAASVVAQAGPQRASGTIQKDELEYQQQAFKQWWNDELVLRLADLPAEGKVPDFRMPYAGHDYPDRGGGTLNAMHKYDQAFHRGRSPAAEYERRDISAHRNGRRDEEPPVRGGLLERLRTARGRERVPSWYGHCNGWTAAAIRHAEPQTSVVRNGVTFTPADIKGLLAEIYMYTESEFLGGVDPAINPATLHLTLGNWLGRGAHPVGMETAVGEVVINYPIYGYQSKIQPLSPRQSDVRTTINYTLNIPRELDKGPANYSKQLVFHYLLDLDEEGRIRGGRYLGDSQRIDMLWTPLQPYPGGHDKNKRGNPHLDVNEVLAIWRESVPEALRKQWLNIDPTELDRVPDTAEAAATTQAPAATAETPRTESSPPSADSASPN
jgi:Transglutaminase elicitor